VTCRNCSYVYNGFLKLNEDFSHHIYVIDNFQCKFVKTHVDLLFFLSLDASFEYGFVDTHAQVDVWKTYHILIHIMHAQMSLKIKFMSIPKEFSFSKFRTKPKSYRLNMQFLFFTLSIKYGWKDILAQLLLKPQNLS